MVPANLPRAILAVHYAEAAQDYLRSLPPEHFMEATAQATQREITLESLALVHARRPEVQVFNELLVQYDRPRERKPGQIVPDNMVVVWQEPIEADGSYDVPLQPVGPFWVLEYVSKHNKRKDYVGSFAKYECGLKVPYYLIFYPDNQELTLFRHTGRKYRAVPPDDHGRCPIPELEIEVGLLDGWIRFWYQGEILPLPADLLRDLDEARRRAEREKQRAEREKQRAEHEKQRAEHEKQRAEHEKQRAEHEKQRAEHEKQRADKASHHADTLQQRLEQEQEIRQTLQRELELLRAGGPAPTRPGGSP